MTKLSTKQLKDMIKETVEAIMAEQPPQPRTTVDPMAAQDIANEKREMPAIIARFNAALKMLEKLTKGSLRRKYEEVYDALANAVYDLEQANPEATAETKAAAREVASWK